MSDHVDIFQAQCFLSWGRHLTRMESTVAVHIAIRSWCKGRAEAEIEPAGIAQEYSVCVCDVERALESMRTRGAIQSLTWTRGGTAAVVALTPRWRMDEGAGG